MWQRPGGEEEVAVKELKCEAMEEDRVKFLQEAAIMSQFNHRNVVRLHGIVTIDEPVSPWEYLVPSIVYNLYMSSDNASKSFLSICLVIIYTQLLIVMELMQNGDLKNYLHRFVTNRRYVGTLSS